jgi:hypothetical protein
VLHRARQSAERRFWAARLAFRATFISRYRLREFHLSQLSHENNSRESVIDETSEFPSVVQNPQRRDFHADDSHHVQNHSNLLLFLLGA